MVHLPQHGTIGFDPQPGFLIDWGDPGVVCFALFLIRWAGVPKIQLFAQMLKFEKVSFSPINSEGSLLIQVVEV